MALSADKPKAWGVGDSPEDARAVALEQLRVYILKQWEMGRVVNTEDFSFRTVEFQPEK